MGMWAALIWPSLTAIILLSIPVLRKRVASFEFFMPWVPVLALIPLGIGLGRSLQVTDYENLGGHAFSCRKWEAWDERVSCRHPKYKTETYTDSEGKTQTRTVQDGYEHMYDVDYHPEWHELLTTLGDWSTSEEHYHKLVSWWGTPTFYDQHRSYHSIDGDMWQTNYDGKWNTLEPVFVCHPWENRTQAAHSLYRFDPVDPKETPVYKKPDEGSGKFILGPWGSDADNLELARINSQVGPHKQCIIFICGWTNKPQSVGVDQQHYWKGGGKNELVVTFSADENGVPQWAYVFSWMDDQTLSYEIRDFITSYTKVNIPKLLSYTRDIVEEKWERKQFSKNAPDGGFSFIRVDPPFWLIVTVHVLSVLFCGGISWYVCVNEVDNVNDPLWDILTDLFNNAKHKCVRLGNDTRDRIDSFRRRYGG